jgi:hypothetical protein
MINHMPVDEYRQCLENVYINAIKKYISPNSTTILLSMDTDNAVTRFMDENNYRFLFMPKTLPGRDLNAIVDYIVASRCNKVFIGNVNPKTYVGSTFSFAIFNKLREEIVKICIDTDHIQEEHSVYL